MKTPPAITMEVQRVLMEGFGRVLEGQGMELGWSRDGRWDVDEKDYERMVTGKTRVLIGAACESGIIIGGGSAKQRAALKEFGECVGVAFQIQDDVLNIVGDEAKYKKEIGGDISEGKRTLMVIHSLRKSKGAEKERLMKLLASKTRDQREIAEIVGIFKRNGSIEFAVEYAKRLALKAKKQLAVLDQKKESTKQLYELADFLVEREV
jgi:geranylgeranyl diphosphate synthase type I